MISDIKDVLGEIKKSSVKTRYSLTYFISDCIPFHVSMFCVFISNIFGGQIRKITEKMLILL